jgi:hypothetical protein
LKKDNGEVNVKMQFYFSMLLFEFGLRQLNLGTGVGFNPQKCGWQ